MSAARGDIHSCLARARGRAWRKTAESERPMRPAALNALFAALTSLAGIGPKQERLYRRLLGREDPRVIDLLLHLPSGTIDRRARPKLSEVVPDTVVTVAVTVGRHRPPPPGRSRVPHLVEVRDETGDL